MSARAALLLLALAACSGSASKERCSEHEAARPVDATLLAFLSRARAAHHITDAAEQSEDLARAIVSLQAVVDGPLPPGGARDAPEVREVLADTLARVADLKSRRGEFDAAGADIRRGLELARERSYFRGHLHEVSGLAAERQAAALEKQGDAAGASAARERALRELQTAMQIQAEVIRHATPQ